MKNIIFLELRKKKGYREYFLKLDFKTTRWIVKSYWKGKYDYETEYSNTFEKYRDALSAFRHFENGPEKPYFSPVQDRQETYDFGT